MKGGAKPPFSYLSFDIAALDDDKISDADYDAILKELVR
jgi:hypothetical protein